MSDKLEPPINLKDLPTSPGIYLFKDASEKIIYIGKAINLRSRVRSYWAQTSWRDRPKLAILVPQIKDIETILTKNEKEALILEANLIYKHQPKYNVLLRDNKSFPWLAITYGEAYPRLVIVRGLDRFRKKYPKAKLFGPFTDGTYMYKLYTIAQKLFPLRKRAKPLYKDRTCLNYDIGKCLGPCQKLITEEDYQGLLDQVELFLKGKHDDLINILNQKMISASEMQQYEKATEYRDQIFIIEKATASQRIVNDDEQCHRDLVGLALDENELSIQLFKMRHGKLISRESYFITLNEYQDIGESLFSLISQIYLMREEDDLPKELLLPEKIGEYELKDLLQEVNQLFEHIIQRKVKIAIPQKGIKKDQIKLAIENAENALLSKQKARAKQLLALQELQDVLELDQTPLEIDCFDISHLGGTEVVASCVRLSEGLPNTSQYRRFKISIDQNDDYTSMHEVVQRRYRSGKNLPDLIVIDGGKGQLSSAIKALESTDYAEIPIISLAKKFEEIYTPSDKIELPYNSPALNILQKIRDEAHRFALSYQRKRREIRDRDDRNGQK